jgi:DNA-binding beta-propeller fold protein YncE
MRLVPLQPLAVRALFAAAVLAALALPAGALAATRPQRARPPIQALGALRQLPAERGCLVARSSPRPSGCARVRALRGPAPFLGSRAVAISGDGRHLYVASSRSNAIAIFRRDVRSGALTQAAGTAGCVAARGSGGCARARALDGPNSLAISADGRHVYATSLLSDAVATFRRDPRTGALAQAGCVAGRAIPGCASARALDGPDVVVASPDGRNVYVGSFRGDAVASFARDAATGALAQLDGASGCLAAAADDGCATALALRAPEGLAISGDGASVYVAAAGGGALLTLARDASSGALAQAGCIVASPLAGCTTGVQLAGANAVAVSPEGDDVYVTSLLSDSLTSFTRAASGTLTQQAGTSACAIHLLAVGCSLARAMDAPEGLAVSPDGASVYVAAFGSGALDAFDRDGAGALMQKPRRPGCVVGRPTPDCLRGRALRGASAVVVSPDGRHVYAAAFRSDALTVFERITRSRGR